MSNVTITQALNAATLNVTNHQQLTDLLQQIVDAAQATVRARYAAISLPDWGKSGFTFVHAGITPETVAALPHTPHHLGVLGRVLDQNEPVIISNIATDPDLVGFPSGHPEMTRFLGVAIRRDSEPLGAIYLADKLDDSIFNDADIQLVELLASHAAVAIDQTRLRLKEQQLVSLQKQHHASLTLHDGAIQSLFAISLNLHAIADELGEKSTDAQRLVTTSLNDVSPVIDALRNFITEAMATGF